MATPIEKRRIITLETKKQIIDASATKKLKELSEQFDMPSSTIKTILDNRQTILKAIDEGGEAKRSHMRPVKHEDLEEGILQWFKAARSKNETVKCPLLMEQAKILAGKLSIQGFEASQGWLEKFKHRHSIVFKGNQGEAANIDLEAPANWREQISHFSPDDVFNADETGLFWQLLPNKTLAFKGERCISGKKSKERVTVLVGSNMSGSKKLPLLVIGKSAKPRCFKNVNPRVAYKSNKKAWMTADLFESWLKQWDRKLKCDQRKVLSSKVLFLDNFTSHSNINLGQITVKFFPPNTTAESQPMDQGVIQNLKVHYRRFLLRERLAAMEGEYDYKPNLLNALQFLRRSWDAVKPETLAKCFRKAGFFLNQQPAEETPSEIRGEQDDEELNNLWVELQALGLAEGVSLQDYLGIDELLVTGGTQTLAEIAEKVSGIEALAEDDEETDVMATNEEAEALPITTREAKDALGILQRYVYQAPNHEAQKACDKLDDFLAEKRSKGLKQKKILDYFAFTNMMFEWFE